MVSVSPPSCAGTRNAPSDPHPTSCRRRGRSGRPTGCGAPRPRRVIVAASRHDPGTAIFSSVRSKDAIRRAVWKAMDREGVRRFPGAQGRIPNFAGAKLAAQSSRRTGVEAGQDGQGQSRRTADPRPPPGAGGGKDVVHGGPAAARRASVPAARPQAADEGQDARGGDDQGRPPPRRVVDVEQVPEARPGPVRLGGRQPEGGPDRQGRRVLRPRVRAAGEAGKCRRSTPWWRRRSTRSRSCARTCRSPTHDIPVDLIATPRAAIEVERAYKRPARASSGTTCSRRRSTRSRCSSGWGTRKPLPARRRQSPRRSQMRPGGKGPLPRRT